MHQHLVPPAVQRSQHAQQCHTEDVSQLRAPSSAATSCGASVVCCPPCCLPGLQGLYARVRRLAEPLLRLRSSEGVISVQNGADLYMARRIEQGIERAEGNYSAITLEVQRSLDYFESQLGKGYITRLLLLPMKRDGEQAMQALAGGLAVNLQRLSLEDLFGDDVPLLDEREQAYCLAAVGAALRQENS